MTNNNQNPLQPNKQQSLNFTPEQKIILVSLALVAGMVVILFVTVLQLYQPQQPQQVGPVGAPSEPTATPRQLTVSDMPTADLPPTDTPVPTITTQWSDAVKDFSDKANRAIEDNATLRAEGKWTPPPTSALPPGCEYNKPCPALSRLDVNPAECDRYFRSMGQILEGCEELLKK